MLPPASTPEQWIDLNSSWVSTSNTEHLSGAIKFCDPTGECQHLVGGDDGSLAIASVDAPLDDARSHFDPPLLAYPQRVLPHGTIESTAPMRVSWFDETRGDRDSGLATLKVQQVGCASIRTPFGRFETVVIETYFSADLRLAKAVNVATMYIAPGIGPVAQSLHRSVRVLGITIQEKHLELVREVKAMTTVAEGYPR